MQTESLSVHKSVDLNSQVLGAMDKVMQLMRGFWSSTG